MVCATADCCNCDWWCFVVCSCLFVCYFAVAARAPPHQRTHLRNSLDPHNPLSIIDNTTIITTAAAAAVTATATTTLHSLSIVRLLRLLRLLKLMRILRTSRLIQRYRAQIDWSFGFLNLTQSMVGMLLCAHWIACMWGWVGNNGHKETTLENSWMSA